MSSLGTAFAKSNFAAFIKSNYAARNLDSEEGRVWGWRYRHICHSLRDLGAFTSSPPTLIYTVNQFMQDSEVAAEADGGENRIRLLWTYLSLMLASRYSSGTRNFGYYGNEVGFIRSVGEIKTDVKFSPVPSNLVFDWNDSHSTTAAYRVLLEVLNLGGINPVTGYREWSKCNIDNTVYYTPSMSGKTYTIHKSTETHSSILMTNGEIVFDELEQCIDYLKKALHTVTNTYTMTDVTGLYTGNSSGCTADPGHGYNHDPVLTWNQQYRYTWDGAGPYFSSLDIDQYILHPGWLAQYTAWGVCINAKLSKNIGGASPFYPITQKNTFYGWIKDNQAEYISQQEAIYIANQWNPTFDYGFGSPNCQYKVGGEIKNFTTLINGNLGHIPTDPAWWQDNGYANVTHYENQFYLRFPPPAARYIPLTNGWITTSAVDNLVFLNYGEQDPYGSVVSPIPGDGNLYTGCYKSFHVQDHFQMNEYQFQSKSALGYKDKYHPKCPFCNRAYIIGGTVSQSRVYGLGFTPAELADMVVPVINRNDGATASVNFYTQIIGNAAVTPVGIQTFNTPTFDMHFQVLDIASGPDTLPVNRTYYCDFGDRSDRSDTTNEYIRNTLTMIITSTELRHSPGSTERDMNIQLTYTNPRVNTAFSITNTNGGRVKWSMGTPTWTDGIFGYFDKSSDDIAYNNGNPLVSNFNLILTDTTFLTTKGVTFRINYTGGANSGWNYTDFYVFYLAKP